MKDTKKEVDLLIQHFHLEPLPLEGGFFSQSYRSKEILPASHLPQRYSSDRCMYAAIYYLLTNQEGGFSALHQLKTDELYHFYLGDPANLLLIYPEGSVEVRTLGHDFSKGQYIQFLVPKGVWQGMKLCEGGDFALLGTTTAPGYEQEDFILGDREVLTNQYPKAASLIQSYTRATHR